MRIVQLVETLEVGGLERVAVDLALALHAAGHWVGVYCFFSAGPLRAELDAAGIPVTEFHKDRRGNASLVWSMARQLRRDRVQILHGHNPGVHHAAALAKAIARVPVCINTRHGAVSSQGQPYQERYFRLVRPLTEHVIFVCDYVRKTVEPWLRYPASRCSVILNGIATERFLRLPAHPGEARPRLRFGAIGRFVPAKGHSVLIEAFASIAPRIPQADLHIYGYGPLQGDLETQVARLGLQNRVHLEGPTSDAARTLQSLDVFVLSSLSEGLPLVILEAMAAGLPIVSTRVGGVPEVAPENSVAWLCEPGDATALAKAMLAASESAALADMGQEGKRLAAAHFGTAEMCRNYTALYAKLLL
ncbi:MAG TPA: glycosyltransferase [Bryobacteraceae bacterium]|nr:glycosyltransferase [Bryobacteraceae bacterium]